MCRARVRLPCQRKQPQSALFRGLRMTVQQGRAKTDATAHGPASFESGGHAPHRGSVLDRAIRRAQLPAAREARGRRCCIATLHSYFESHDLRCSSKKARTCSGSSAPRNSTPAGSGSGLKTLSGVGIFGGLASMIFLLYKLIICLSPRFTPAPDAVHKLFVALTAQVNKVTECLNRIYRLAIHTATSAPLVKPLLYSLPFPFSPCAAGVPAVSCRNLRTVHP
jgi:hypothetical protein